MNGNSCYWIDYNGNCWTYQQVVDYWKNLDYDYSTGSYGYPEQQVQQVANEFSIRWNDILLIATQYWWLGLIFIVGAITLGIVLFRVLGNNKYASELFKLWGWKK